MVPKSRNRPARSIILHAWLCSVILFFAGPTWCQDLQRGTLRLGVVLDAENQGLVSVYNQTLNEIRALLSSTHEVTVSQTLYAEWDAKKAKTHIQSLLDDNQVGMLLTFGVVTGAAVANVGSYSKPVVALGIVDPIVKKDTINKSSATGIDNLSFVLLNWPVQNDLAYFREIVPFKSVALIYTAALKEQIRQQRDICGTEPILQDVVTDLVFADQDIAATLAAIPKKVDAVYLGFVPEYTADDWRRLMDGINARKLPSFSWQLEHLQNGVMASNATEADEKKLARRIALNVEAILAGTNAGTLPMLLDFDTRLTLNSKTMRLVGFHAPWDILTRAEFIEDDLLGNERTIDLADVFLEAQARSLTLRLADQDVASLERDIALAKGRLRPFVNFSATGLRIDKDRAAASLGMQAKTTLSSRLDVQHLLYSERARAAVALQRFAYDAQGESRNQVRLDVALQAGLAYLDVLRSKAQIEIRKKDLQQTRRNLQIAKQRQEVGYSGRSDVYRWESQVATANQAIIEARVQDYLAQANLNRLLDRPQDQPFRSKDGSSAETRLADFYRQGFSQYLRTPHDLEILIAFLVQESRKLLPEIKALDLAIGAGQRQLRSDLRRRFTPEVALQGQGDYLLSRSGQGSDDSLPGAPNDFAWSVALNLSIPLFEGGTIRQQVAKSRIDLRGLEIQRDDLLQALALAIRFQLGEMVRAYFNLDSSRKAADLAALSLDLVKDGYAKGSLAIAQLLDAQLAATRASEAAAIAKWDHLAAILQLERAIGRYSFNDSADRRADIIARFLEFSKNHPQK